VPRPLGGAGAIFAHRGAIRKFLFVFPTIAPLRKTCWDYRFLFYKSCYKSNAKIV